jgi:hypothetical protein
MLGIPHIFKFFWPQAGSERKVFLLSFCVALIFSAYTDHLWEDYYITYRASKNLAMGKGLVFTEGQRVHTFTSPLGVLLPAVCSAVTLNQSDTAAVWLFRLVACTFLGLTAVFLYRLAIHAGWGRWAKILLIGLFAFDAKTVDYSINGMETAMLVFFLTLTLYALVQLDKHGWKLLGCAWAGLMWTRPDAFIYIGMTALAYALFSLGWRNWKVSLQKHLPLFLKAGLITTCLYLPWLLWAWSYYGSPVPNTIVAKGLGRVHIETLAYLRAAIAFPVKVLYEDTSLFATLAPALPDYGPWPGGGIWVWRLVPLVPAIYWAIPGGNPLARACSLAFVGGHYYLTRVSPHPFAWYVPPVTLLGLLPLADAANRLTLWLAKLKAPEVKRLCQTGMAGILCGVVLVHFFTLTLVARQMRTQQQIVENGLRTRLGLWLREQATSPQDTVFLECLGYIGYFSGLKMLDWPGLSSPEVIKARRETGYLGYMDLRLLAVLKPDWVVLRRSEYEPELAKDDSFLAQNYQVAKVFDVSAEVENAPLRYGRGYLKFDQHFTVFKLKPPTPGDKALPVSSGEAIR